MLMDQTLKHYGILGMKWGIRRYQNEDGSLTEAGRARLEKKDNKWLKKNYAKVYSKTYKKSRGEIQSYQKKVLDKTYSEKGRTYMNEYNRKLAEIMNTKVGDVEAPSGKVVKFVAKRGDVGVYMALADRGYDMSKIQKGVWNEGRIAYKKQKVDMV